MKIKKTLLLSIPAIALAMGAITFTTLANKTNEAVATHAADYSRSSRSVTLNGDKSINAKFNVTDNNLTMNGWLLCLLENKPDYDLTTRKLNNSSDYHPYTNTNVMHYFFASSTAKTGEMNITWAANSADQKEAWSKTETAGAEGKTLADYLDGTNWYVVIGLRHTANYGYSTEDNPIGEGKGDIWENCDYYLGRYSNLFGNCPEGETYLDLTESSFWKNDNAKFGVYYWDNDSHNAFSSFAVSDNGYYIASYELDFVPTNMKAVRFNSAATVPNWDDKWNEGEDNTFYEYGVIGIYEEGENKNKSWSDGLAELHGLDETIVLDHYKRNNNQSEHYNERVTLDAGDEFTVSYDGNQYYSFSAHESLMEEDNEYFEVKNNKIHVNKGGEFALYFNTDSTVRSLYITKVDIAAADEWSLAFLGKNCTDTMNGWETFRTQFTHLSDGARNILESIEHEPDPTKILSGYPAQAVQRYDHVLISHPGEYTDFMGRINSGKLTLANYHSIFAAKENTAPIIIIVISLVAAGLLGSFFVIKKKKHN